MRQIERGILYEDGYLGVTVAGMVFPHGTIMIDAPIRLEDANAWRSHLMNQRRGSNRLLILLDSHPDRSLGARTMDSTILAHQNTAEVFRTRPMIFKGINVESGAIWEIYNEAIGMRWAMPDITFSDQISLHWGGPEVSLEHHPGPSPGSSWVIIPEYQIVFIGDAVVIDQPVFLADADLDEWIESLEELRSSYKNYQLISGRGGLTDINAVQVQIKYLRKIKRGLERLANRDADPDETEKLLPSLLSDLNFASNWHELYEQRLRHGLRAYYQKVYMPKSVQEDSRIEDEA
jgi:glyoxylase-like metal-dependent hydrolase (beta-lactamase superfamily II)